MIFLPPSSVQYYVVSNHQSIDDSQLQLASTKMVNAPKTREELLRNFLFEAGFDIFHGPFSPSVYNDLLESEGLVEAGLLSKLPNQMTVKSASTTTPSIRGDSSIYDNEETKQEVDAYLIGNTKHLWPIFLQWLHSENEIKMQQRQSSLDETTANNNKATSHKDNDQLLIDDPLDTYEQTIIREAVEKVCTSGRTLLYWSSDYDPARMVSMARIASCTGFSYLDPQTHLSVHPTYGTWHSYRAVLLIPKESSTLTSKLSISLLPNPTSPLDQKAAKEAFDKALEISTGTIETHTDASSCLDEESRSKLSEELGRGTYKDDKSEEGLSPSLPNNNSDRKTRVANAWITLRDTITIGRKIYRFDDHQLLYHYTKDPQWLFKGIKDLGIGIAP